MVFNLCRGFRHHGVPLIQSSHDRAIANRSETIDNSARITPLLQK